MRKQKFPFYSSTTEEKEKINLPKESKKEKEEVEVEVEVDEDIDTISTETNPLTVKNDLVIKKQSKKEIIRNISRRSASFTFVGLTYVADSYTNTKFVASLGDEALAATFLIEASLGLLMGIYISLEQPVAVLSCTYDGEIKKLSKEELRDEVAISRAERSVGEVIQQGWLIGAGVCIPLAITFWNMKPILIFLGQNENSSELVSQFMRYFVFSLPFRVMNGVSTNLVAATDREWFLIPYNLITLGVGIASGYLFTYGEAGFPQMGVAGFGASRIVSQITGFLLINTYFIANKSIRRYGIYYPRKATLSYFKEIMRLGLPLILYSLAANGTNFTLSMFIGWLGTFPTAVAQTADQYMSWIQMLGSAIASGTCVPVGQLFGAGSLDEIRSYATMGILLASSFYVIPLAVFSFFPMQLARFFIQENINEAESFIRASFMFSLANNYTAFLKLMNTYNLNSIRENLSPTLITALLDILVTLPLAYGLSQAANFGLTGVNIGILVGTTLTAGSLLKKWYWDTSPAALPVKYEQMKAREETRASENSSYFGQVGGYFSSCISSVRNRMSFWSYNGQTNRVQEEEKYQEVPIEEIDEDTFGKNR